MGWEAFLHVPHPGQGPTLVGLGSAAARLPPEPGWQVSSRQATASALPGRRAFYKHKFPATLASDAGAFGGCWSSSAAIGCSRGQSHGQGPGCCSSDIPRQAPPSRFSLLLHSPWLQESYLWGCGHFGVCSEDSPQNFHVIINPESWLPVPGRAPKFCLHL